MKSVMEGNNFGFEWVMMYIGVMVCQFKGGFVSFCVGVYKYYVFGKCCFNQFMFKMQRWFIGENVIDMLQSFVLGF